MAHGNCLLHSLHSLRFFPGNLSFSVRVSPSKKPPMKGPAKVMNLLHNEDGYGYLGDLCCPGYNLSSHGPVSGNLKWRVVCRRPSHIFTVLLAMDMPEGEYLQMRRRALRGSTRRFHGSTLRKNSVLFGHVRTNRSNTKHLVPASPFRLAYFCSSEFLAKTACRFITGEGQIMRACSARMNNAQGAARVSLILTHRPSERRVWVGGCGQQK